MPPRAIFYVCLQPSKEEWNVYLSVCASTVWTLCDRGYSCLLLSLLAPLLRPAFVFYGGVGGANKYIYLFPVRSVQRFHFPPIGSPLLEVLRISVRQLLSFFKHAAEDTNYPSSPKGRFFFFCSKTLMSEMRLNESRSSNKN